MIVSILSYAQTFREEHKPDKVFAKYCLRYHNYYDGLNEFEGLLKLHSKDDYYRWGVGYCHLQLNIDKSKAIPYFEAIINKDDADPSVYYDLGDAYLQTNNLEKAEEAFLNYIKSGIKDEHLISAKRQLQIINNAKQAFNNPIKVKITNAGVKVNTEFPDFSPYINSTEKFMIFSRQASTNAGRYRHEDGYYTSDVYYTNFKFGKWSKVRSFSSVINSPAIEKNGYLSKNASYLYVYKEDLMGKQKKHIIYNKRGRSYAYPIELKIDGMNMQDIKSLSISNDGKWIVFSAPSKSNNRENLDLYYCRLKSNGFWGDPTAFDSTVNTIYNESFPYFTPNKNTFVFASQGHNSIGGYDLFTSNIIADSSLHISNITNIGYPVNTCMDDKTISFAANNRYAYISGLRDGGHGDLDIYRVVFEEEAALMTVIHGNVFNQNEFSMMDILKAENDHIDTLNFPINKKYKRLLHRSKDSTVAQEYLKNNLIPYNKLDININVIDKNNNKAVGNFIVKERDASYSIILKPGEYRITFSRKGYGKAVFDNIIIEDFNLRNRNMEMNVLLENI